MIKPRVSGFSSQLLLLCMIVDRMRFDGERRVGDHQQMLIRERGVTIKERTDFYFVYFGLTFDYGLFRFAVFLRGGVRYRHMSLAKSTMMYYSVKLGDDRCCSNRSYCSLFWTSTNIECRPRWSSKKKMPYYWIYLMLDLTTGIVDSHY